MARRVTVESAVDRTSLLQVESKIALETRSDPVRFTAIRLIMMVLLAASTNASWSFEVPELTPNVTDRAGVLSAREISDLNGTIARLRRESDIYAAVLIVRSTQPETIEQAAIQTFDRWQ